MNTDHASYDQHTEHLFFFRGEAIPMTALTFAFVGFVAGLLTMIIISLYRYVIRVMSH